MDEIEGFLNQRMIDSAEVGIQGRIGEMLLVNSEFQETWTKQIGKATIRNISQKNR